MVHFFLILFITFICHLRKEKRFSVPVYEWKMEVQRASAEKKRNKEVQQCIQRHISELQSKPDLEFMVRELFCCLNGKVTYQS